MTQLGCLEFHVQTWIEGHSREVVVLELERYISTTFDHCICQMQQHPSDGDQLQVEEHAGVPATVSVPDCHAQANETCATTSLTHFTFCASNGHVYHDVCSLVHDICDDHTIGADPHPDPNLCPNMIHTTTTEPPLSAFETSLYSAIEHGIDDRLRASRAKGITPKQALPIFSAQDHAHKRYVRNPDCWAADLDLTCISPWNSNLSNRKAGTLISPRHAVWARHYSIRLNSTLRFVDRRGAVVERRVVGTRLVDSHGGSGFYGRDIVVGVLDSDVPDTVSFAKVMPHHLLTMHPGHNVHLPVLSTDQEEKALVTDFLLYHNHSISLRAPSTSSIHHDYYEPKIVGDSGNPSFFVLGDELVLLFTFTTGGPGGGTNLIGHFHDINHQMNVLGGGYQLTEVDLSRFLSAQETLPSVIG
ncbi:uncharacterized protein LOC143293099 [Babylonia areolata]|uniref:uncharacterized protein LOC143293099 n=1 Tax=Babylonia areolata TaxID=304850 RepID=UPI003FD2A122